MTRKVSRVFDRAAALRCKLVRQMVTVASEADPALGETLARISDRDPANTAEVIAALMAALKGKSTAGPAALQVLGRAADYASRYSGGVPPELLAAVPDVGDATFAANEEIRIAAFNALEGFAADAGPDVAAAFATRDYSSASTPEVIAAIQALRACGPDLAGGAAGWVAGLLEHDDVAVVELACMTLGWMGAEAVGFIEQLVLLATGPHRQLRLAAASALIEIDPTAAVLSKRVSDPVQREEVLSALREKGAEGRTTRAKLGRSGRRRGTAIKQLLMTEVLLKHHGVGTGQFNNEPASQKRLQELTGWNQSKVSRAMKEIFGENPMKTYKHACKASSGLVKYLVVPGAVRRKGKPIDKDGD